MKRIKLPAGICHDLADRRNPRSRPTGELYLSRRAVGTGLTGGTGPGRHPLLLARAAAWKHVQTSSPFSPNPPFIVYVLAVPRGKVVFISEETALLKHKG